jgi:hypothetical protein
VFEGRREIASDVADGPSSVILEQVANGVAGRMAVRDLLAGGAEMDSMSKWLLKGGHVVDPVWELSRKAAQFVRSVYESVVADAPWCMVILCFPLLGMMTWYLEVPGVNGERRRDTRGPSIDDVKRLLIGASVCGPQGLKSTHPAPDKYACMP